MLTDLQYERMAQLIALSALSKHASLISQLEVRSTANDLNGNTVPRGLLVSYSNYVKSQMHLCIVEDLFGRSLFDYAGALKYLNGFKSYRVQAEKVLRYFYTDMSAFLVNNPENIFLKIVVDLDFTEDIVDVQSVKLEFKTILDSIQKPNLYQLVSKFRYACIIDNIDNANDALAKIDSYVVAAILAEQAKQEDVKMLRMVNWDVVEV